MGLRGCSLHSACPQIRTRSVAAPSWLSCTQSPHISNRRRANLAQLCSSQRDTNNKSAVKASAASASPSGVKSPDQDSFILSTVSEIDKDDNNALANRISDQTGPAASSRTGDDSSGSQYWQELLSSPEPEMFGHRAKSASDAAVLRRKGHLKEQDKMIEFLLAMHHTHTSEEAMQKMERWIMEHRQEPRHSRLRKMVPSIGSFFTPLKLVEAFSEFDQFFALSRRKYVPPNFAEIRHILNIAQVSATFNFAGLHTKLHWRQKYSSPAWTSLCQLHCS